MLSDRLNDALNGDEDDCRRDWSRATSDETTVSVFTASGPHEATIVDESFGGLGLLILSDDKLQVGQQVGLLYGGISLQASIRWVHPLGDGRQHLGIEWRSDRRQRMCDRRRMMHSAKVQHERRQAESDRRQTVEPSRDSDGKARVVSIGGLPMVCGLPEDQSGGVVEVILPGGIPYEVRLEDLQSSSMLERRAQLEHLNRELSILVGVYELGHPQTKDEAIEAVLSYEFAEHPA